MALVSDLENFDVIDELNKTKFSIVDLLPQAPETIIVDPKTCANILKLMYHSTTLLIDSIDKFYVQKSYPHFDPHVGENACQIRAYIFFLLSRINYLHTAYKRIHFLEKKKVELKNLLNSKVVYKINGKNLTVNELLLKYNLSFSIPLNEILVYKSYFLTIFRKKINSLFYMDDLNISDYLKISKFLAKKIVYKYQNFLSCISCVFIKKIAQNVGLEEKDYIHLFSHTLHSDGKMIYPCFFSSKILFMHMKKTRCPVLILLETITDKETRKDFIFFNNGDDQGCLLTPNNTPLKDVLCIVFACSRTANMPLSVTALLKNLNCFGLYDILLMNMAAHPQLSGSKLISFVNQLVLDTIELTAAEEKVKEEFLTLKSKAHKYGFSLKNPSMLLVKHIFIDTIGNQINLQQNNICVREPIDMQY